MQYLRALERLVDELELGESVEILNGVRDVELLAYWAVADVFVCLSEHEGFCVPVLEAMELGVPVVAYAAAAVPETLGGTGVLVEDKDPLTVAMAVDEVCRPGAWRDALVSAGKERAATFSLENTSKQLLSGIEAYPEPISGPHRSVAHRASLQRTRGRAPSAPPRRPPSCTGPLAGGLCGPVPGERRCPR